MRFGIACAAAIAAASIAIGRAAPAADLFAPATVVELGIKAPFTDLFRNSRQPGDDYSVDGTVTYRDAGGQQVTLDGVKISVRGNTSRRSSECPFPKLKLKFEKSDAFTTSIFKSAPLLKIGTHCGEREDGLTPRFGRLANERSPHREAFVYRLFARLGVPTLEARPARITYVFTDPEPDSSPDERQPIVRDAFLLEDEGAAAARLGAAGSIDEKHFDSADKTFRPADVARLAFAEAMIGNFDWCLKMRAGDAYRCDARHPLWNLLALKSEDGAFPVPYDFDVSGIVAGHHDWYSKAFPDRFGAVTSHAEIEVISQLQRTRTLFDRADLDRTRRDFAAHRAAAFEAIGEGALDAEGQAIARKYLTAFFDEITDEARFYRPVVVNRGGKAFDDPDRTRVVCGASDTIPVGTPVGERPEGGGARGAMRRVDLLDSLWHWATHCPAIRGGPVWIDSSLIGNEYPR